MIKKGKRPLANYLEFQYNEREFEEIENGKIVSLQPVQAQEDKHSPVQANARQKVE